MWGHGGSTVSFSDNRSDRWRHALFASGAKQVRATDNTASQFLGTAIVVDKSELPAHVFGNVALSDNSKDEAVKITGSQGVVLENSRKATDRKTETSEAATTDTRKNAVDVKPSQ